jgi:4-hydroxybenzoate polyprenyltransferase
MENWFKGYHHFYTGIILAIAGFVLMGNGWYWTGLFVIAVGIIVILDDVWQHFRQKNNPEYHSPLHRLYVYIWKKSAFIRWLNRIADKILGK